MSQTLLDLIAAIQALPSSPAAIVALVLIGVLLIGTVLIARGLVSR